MEHMEHMEHMGWIMLDSAVFVHFNPLENVMDYPLAKPQNPNSWMVYTGKSCLKG